MRYRENFIYQGGIIRTGDTMKKMTWVLLGLLLLLLIAAVVYAGGGQAIVPVKPGYAAYW